MSPSPIAFLKAALLSAASLFVACHSALTADLGFLAKDGAPAADIVTAEKPTRAAALAASELQKYVEQISGAKLPVVTVPGTDFPNHVFVGPSRFAAEHGVSAEGLQKDMFRAVSGKGFLALVGKDGDFDLGPELMQFKWDDKDPAQSWNSPLQKQWEKITGESWKTPFSISQFSPGRGFSKTLNISLADEVGTLYAVNEFIRTLGVEWYMPGPSGEVVPHSPTLEIPQIDKTVKPAFERREMTFVAPRFDTPRQVNDTLWYFRIGLGTDYPTWVMHSFQFLHSHPDAAKKYPEYFALFDGKPAVDVGRHGFASVSSPAFKDAMVRYARAVFDTYPWVKAFPVVPTDGYWRIPDQDKDKVTPERGDMGVMSDLIWGFVNDVAKEVKKTHPDKKIVGLAYSTYRLPPEKIDKLEDNVEVYIAVPQRRYLGPDAQKRITYLREEWSKKVAPGNLNSWDYYLHSALDRPTSGLPMIFPHLMARDVKSLKGVYTAEFIEAPRHTMAAGVSSNETAIMMPGLNHLNYFITARAYWNPDMDIEKVLADYYRQFFGPAEKQMREFHQIVESAPWESWTPDQIRRLQALLKEGQEAAGDTVYGRRIKMMETESQKRLNQLLAKRSAGYDITLPMVKVEKEPATSPEMFDQDFVGKFPLFELQDPFLGAGRRAPLRAQIRFGQSGSFLYLFAESATPKKQTSTLKKDDPDIVKDDAVRFIVETSRDNKYLIAVNSDGTVLDARMNADNSLDPSWDSKAEAIVTPSEAGWKMAARIPLSQLGSQGPTKDDYWRLNVARNLPDSIAPAGSTVLVSEGTYGTTLMQNSARLIPGPKGGFPKQTDTEGAREDGQF